MIELYLSSKIGQVDFHEVFLIENQQLTELLT
jgi:hypothetical protein